MNRFFKNVHISSMHWSVAVADVVGRVLYYRVRSSLSHLWCSPRRRWRCTDFFLALRTMSAGTLIAETLVHESCVHMM